MKSYCAWKQLKADYSKCVREKKIAGKVKYIYWKRLVLVNLTLFRMGLFRAAHWWLLPKTCHIYSAMMKLCTVIPYLKKIQKINHVIHPLSFADISIFSSEISNFCYKKNADIDCLFKHNFWFFLTLFESLIVVLINMVAILML